MVACGNQKIEALALCSSGKDFCSPCGNCRQILSEFCDPDTKIYMFVGDSKQKLMLFKELLPEPFNNND